MKNQVLIIVSFTFCLTSYAQVNPSPPPAPGPKAKFVYDATGNRVQRYIENPSYLIKNATPKDEYSNKNMDSLFIHNFDTLALTLQKKEEAINRALAYGIELYPNPTTQRFAFYTNSPNPTEIKLAVYDNYGKYVCSKTHVGNKTEISLVGYADGTYHIMVQLPDGDKLHYKIIKVQ